MKKTIAIILLVVFFTCFSGGGYAMEDQTQEVFIKSLIMKIGSSTSYTRSLNTYLDYQNQEVMPFIENGITYVPMRFVIEHLNGKVKWDIQTQMVKIYYDNTVYQWNGQELTLNGKQIFMESPCLLRDCRWFIPILEWNDRILGEKLTLKEDYIILSPVNVAIPDNLYPTIDKYYREYVSSHGTLLPIYKNNQAGLIDLKGEVVIEPKYRSIDVKKDKPILACTLGGENMVITDDESIICRIEDSNSLKWAIGNEKMIMGVKDSSGPPIPGKTATLYDITGDNVEKRVGETLLELKNGVVFAYQNGVKVEETVLNDGSKLCVLKNLSGNALYESVLPTELKLSTQIQNDQVMILMENGEKWGWLDLDGNLIEATNTEPTNVPPTPSVPKPQIKNGVYIKYTADRENGIYNYSCLTENGKLLLDNGTQYLGWASFDDGIIEYDTDSYTGYMDTSLQTIYIFDKLNRPNPLYPPG